MGYINPAEIVRHHRSCETLRQHGFQAYLVGGCVRDLLLEREPEDYDVATDATPEQVMRIFPETYAVGAQFGVVLVPGAGCGSNLRRCPSRSLTLRRGRDLSQRYRLLRRPPSG